MTPITNACARRKAEGGFSVVELMIVGAIIIVLTAISFFLLAPHKRSHRSEDAAAQATNFLRDAYQRALAQRQTFRVQIDRANQIISIIDENRLPVGDEKEVRRDVLLDQVTLDPPVFGATPIGAPPAPYNYSAAAYASNLWVARFRSDGSVVDASGNPVSATLYFSPVNLKTTEKTLIRAVTVFGPSGSIRLWKYDGANFNAGAN